MADDLSSKLFAAGETYTNVETFATSSKEVNAGALRLEGAFYGSAGYRALKIMKRAGFEMTTVGDHASVAWPGVFRRTYVESMSHGLPFYTTSGMMMAKPEPDRLISRAITPNLQELIVSEGTLLISRSGTVGRVVVATADLAGAVVTEDAIRVVRHDANYKGLLHAFLLSDAGQFLLTRSKSGSVVEHIYEADVSTLPLPLLPKALRREMTQLVDEACKLRVKANSLLCEAEEDVQRSCFLPDLQEFGPRPSCDGSAECMTFTASSGERFVPQRGYGELRLDATYHEPTAVALARRILASDNGHRLGDLVRGVHNSALRKRVYVEDRSLGVPLIGGKQLMQWRPGDVNYLSKGLTRNLPQETVECGWTLVSCGGTLGRTMFVHRNFEGCAASQDVMRVLPDPSRAAPGFIYAFLASPYGQVQIHQRGYGSVIPRLRDFQFLSVAIPCPRDRGEAVHEKVIAAFDARADAREAEDRAGGLFSTALERGRDYIESEWGSEY